MNKNVFGIVGSRDWIDGQAIVRKVKWINKHFPGSVIVSGGAKNVDSIGEGTAWKLGMSVLSYRPQNFKGKLVIALYVDDEFNAIVHYGPFKSYGQAAHYRNGLIASEANAPDAKFDIYAFQRNGSSGTQGTIDKARKQGKRVKVYEER